MVGYAQQPTPSDVDGKAKLVNAGRLKVCITYAVQFPDPEA